MKKNLPDGLMEFAREFSHFKTPGIRTMGATEINHQYRGEPDFLDTIGTLMLWYELAAVGLPATFFLTANSGDETDIRVGYKDARLFMDINVKASKTDIRPNEEPCSWGNIPVKHEELGLLRKNSLRNTSIHEMPKLTVEKSVEKGVTAKHNGTTTKLPHIYVKVFVHLYKKYIFDEPFRPHVHFCNWIPTYSSEFRNEVESFENSMASGRPTRISGINHPGLWIEPNKTRPFNKLAPYLRHALGEKES